MLCNNFFRSLSNLAESINTIDARIQTRIPTPTYPMLTADTRESSALVNLRIVDDNVDTFTARRRCISRIFS
jgi:hypothetical protein